MHPVIATLRARRKARGLSQVDLARMIGTSDTGLNTRESGKSRWASLELLERWATALGYRLVLIEREGGTKSDAR